MQPDTTCHVLVRMRLSRLLLVLPLLSPLACDDDTNDGGGTPGTTSDTGAETGSNGDTTADPDGTSGDTATTGTSAPGMTTGDDETTEGDSESSTSGSATTASDTGDAEGSTGEVPTSGPGVLPGEDGREAMCRRALECGSTYYDDEQECLDAGTDYWGECAEVIEALDAFGACMSEVACDDYNPDAYNPANTVCSELWSDVQDAGPC